MTLINVDAGKFDKQFVSQLRLCIAQNRQRVESKFVPRQHVSGHRFRDDDRVLRVALSGLILSRCISVYGDEYEQRKLEAIEQSKDLTFDEISTLAIEALFISAGSDYHYLYEKDWG